MVKELAIIHLYAKICLDALNNPFNFENLKKNGGAKTGDFLFLTKGLGVGILTTAQKKDLLLSEHANIALESMTKLNVFGEKVSSRVVSCCLANLKIG